MKICCFLILLLIFAACGKHLGTHRTKRNVKPIKNVTTFELDVNGTLSESSTSHPHESAESVSVVKNIIQKPKVVVTFLTTNTSQLTPYNESEESPHFDPFQRLLQFFFSSLSRDNAREPQAQLVHSEDCNCKIKRKDHVIHLSDVSLFENQSNSRLQLQDDCNEFGLCTAHKNEEQKRAVISFTESVNSSNVLGTKEMNKTPSVITSEWLAANDSQSFITNSDSSQIDALPSPHDTNASTSSKLHADENDKLISAKLKGNGAGASTLKTGTTATTKKDVNSLVLELPKYKRHYFLSISGGTGERTTASRNSDETLTIKQRETMMPSSEGGEANKFTYNNSQKVVYRTDFGGEATNGRTPILSVRSRRNTNGIDLGSKVNVTKSKLKEMNQTEISSKQISSKFNVAEDPQQIKNNSDEVLASTKQISKIPYEVSASNNDLQVLKNPGMISIRNLNNEFLFNSNTLSRNPREVTVLDGTKHILVNPNFGKISTKPSGDIVSTSLEEISRDSNEITNRELSKNLNGISAIRDTRNMKKIMDFKMSASIPNYVFNSVESKDINHVIEGLGDAKKLDRTIRNVEEFASTHPHEVSATSEDSRTMRTSLNEVGGNMGLRTTTNGKHLQEIADARTLKKVIGNNPSTGHDKKNASLSQRGRRNSKEPEFLEADDNLDFKDMMNRLKKILSLNQKRTNEDIKLLEQVVETTPVGDATDTTDTVDTADTTTSTTFNGSTTKSPYDEDIGLPVYNEDAKPSRKLQYSQWSPFFYVTIPTVAAFVVITLGLCLCLRPNSVCCRLFLTDPTVVKT